MRPLPPPPSRTPLADLSIALSRPPAALAFRTAKSPLYAPTLLLSNVLSAVALLSAWVYRAGTPDLYALDSHGPMGYVVLGLYYALGAWDVGRLVGRAAGAGSGWTDKVRALLKGGRTGGAAHLAEYQSLASAKVERKVGNGDVERGTVVFKLATDDEEDEEEVQLSASPTPVDGARTAGRQPTPIYTGFSAGQQAFFLSDEPSPTSSTSTLHHHHHSERTDTAAAEDDDEVASSHLSRAQAQLETLVWRSLVVLGFACTVSGVTVFAGACRAGASLPFTVFFHPHTSLPYRDDGLTSASNCPPARPQSTSTAASRTSSRAASSSRTAS